MTPTPHDALFRTTFSDLANLRAELERVLPLALTTRIDWPSLEQVPGTFVDAHLSRRESDLLFRVKIDGREAYIYVLFEHQSEPDGRMALRLLRYVVRIWERFERLPLGVRLPPIVPVVLSHSSRGWTAPTRLEDLLDLPEAGALRDALIDLVPKFRYVVDDLSTVTDRELAEQVASAWLRLVLVLLRDGRRVRMADLLRLHLHLIHAVATGWPLEVLRQVMSYAAHVAGEDEEVDLRAVIATLGPGTREIAMRSIADKYRELGLDEGRAEGRAEGLRTMLRKLIRLRFGIVDAAAAAQIDTAPVERLEVWTERILVAQSIDQLFAD